MLLRSSTRGDRRSCEDGHDGGVGRPGVEVVLPIAHEVVVLGLVGQEARGALLPAGEGVAQVRGCHPRAQHVPLLRRPPLFDGASAEDDPRVGVVLGELAGDAEDGKVGQSEVPISWKA